MPVTSRSLAGSCSIRSNIASLNARTRTRAQVGPMPRIMPEPKYFSIPSSVIGCVVVICVALNCKPCSRSVVHHPVALMNSPALPARLDPQPAKAVLGAVVGDVLHQAGQRLRRCRCVTCS